MEKSLHLLDSSAKHRVWAVSIVLLLSILPTSGCSTRAGWQYEPSLARQSAVHLPVDLAVDHFDDQRQTTNERYFWACVIPLVPDCTSDYHRPENANGFLTEAAYNFRPDDDLAEATAKELARTGIFRDVFLTERKADPGAPLLMRGTITNTDWYGAEYSYLLGPYGSLPWLFGLPIGSARNSLELKLELVQVSDRRVLWSYKIHQTYQTTEGIYYNYATDFGYPQMFKAGIERAAASLQSYVESQPPHFWEGVVGASRKTGAAVN